MHLYSDFNIYKLEIFGFGVISHSCFYVGPHFSVVSLGTTLIQFSDTLALCLSSEWKE